jgi:hypothetical protein
MKMAKEITFPIDDQHEVTFRLATDEDETLVEIHQGFTLVADGVLSTAEVVKKMKEFAK